MSRWIEDPQGREEVEKVTRFLKLPVWKPQYLGKFREFWNELWEKIDTNAESSALTLSGKEDSFLKNTAFNKDFGVAREQVLEGAKLAEILGIQYGGLLNNNTTKKRGLGYYCTVNESIYKCKEDTQLNYAESNYFDAISNDDLLGKLQNLLEVEIVEIVLHNSIDIGNGFAIFLGEIKLNKKIRSVTCINRKAGYSETVVITEDGMGIECNCIYPIGSASNAFSEKTKVIVNYL